MAESAPAPATAEPAVPARRGFRLGLRSRFTLYLSAFLLFIMGVAAYLVTGQQRVALEDETKARGIALARTLAANSVEPLSLGAEASLQLMLLTKTVIQTGDEAGGGETVVPASLSSMVWRYVVSFGGGDGESGVRNEGVLFARIVDPAGKVIAVADAQRPAEEWMREMDAPYQPVPGTRLLSPGQDEQVWESPHAGGTWVIAVPIRQRTLVAGMDSEAAPAAGAPASGGFMGSVYLGMSQSVVRRALALVYSKFVYMAVLVLVLAVVIALMISGTLVRPIHLLRDGALAVAKGLFNTQVDVVRRDELGELAFAFNGMTKGLAERELIRGAFGAYVSSDVLTDILANPEAMQTIGGVKRTVTVVFTDVRGFTSMAGKIEAEQVVGIINEYLDIQAKQVREYRGHVDKYIGDAMRAVFGIPAEGPDDAERAVRCAWAIKLEVAKLVAVRKAKGEQHPLVGIGVDTGEVVAGNIGAASAKLDYTVIGDPVAMSEACMDLARDPDAEGGQVVLTEGTYEKVRDLVEVRQLPDLVVQGHQSATKVYEMTGLKGTGAS